MNKRKYALQLNPEEMEVLVTALDDYSTQLLKQFVSQRGTTMSYIKTSGLGLATVLLTYFNGLLDAEYLEEQAERQVENETDV